MFSINDAWNQHSISVHSHSTNKKANKDIICHPAQTTKLPKVDKNTKTFNTNN